MTRRLLLTLSLLLVTSCNNCGEEKAAPAAPPGKPEPPVIVHPKLPDGGRGKARIVDVTERNNSPFEAGVLEDPP